MKIFEGLSKLMIAKARSKRNAEIDFFLDGNVYAFDSSTISLCLSAFWWSKLHHDKGGVKLHTLLDRTDLQDLFKAVSQEKEYQNDTQLKLVFFSGHEWNRIY